MDESRLGVTLRNWRVDEERGNEEGRGKEIISDNINSPPKFEPHFTNLVTTKYYRVFFSDALYHFGHRDVKIIFNLSHDITALFMIVFCSRLLLYPKSVRAYALTNLGRRFG